MNWPLDTAPRDYVLGHARAVLPDRILEDARIVVREGIIAEVRAHPPAAPSDVDARGLLCLPGLVDVHSDALERERLPRPGAELPWDFALLSLEGKLRAAAVTTVFHGAGFQHKTSRGTERNPVTAVRLCETVRTRGPAPVDHRVLYRLDVRSAEGAAVLAGQLRGPRPLVSHEDHTPGLGQYADRTQMERYLIGADGLSAEQARTHVDEMISERGRLGGVLEQNLGWLGELANADRIRLLGHDPASATEVRALHGRGGSVAEFPTTLEAARTARELGLPIVMGAPNVLRGHSHSGNVSAGELLEHGLVTALASDYLPSGLLAAVGKVAYSRQGSLSEAVRLVTSGPAQIAGLTDRGRITEGQRADLVLAHLGARWPEVRSVLSSAVQHSQDDREGAMACPA
ncbi:alpha-D-ribose 1-methylphosphonate 5-triphosphate diphosphatase [Sciscionella sediminilitoris]|uniref:alpha-D-ribose 1-methylphosphonate 5-triphosphate diphosphatase n=1 Tax=Sciscionella sediminilitoris TaxID=1445613 RepID=UPI00068B5443|nr:alpha-D-ribose 1-methylphosphonate 5-triphosphate diphosphatase [Sciscionella sp. SE31]